MEKIGIIFGLLVFGILLFGCTSVKDIDYTNYTDYYTDNYTDYTDYTDYTQDYVPDDTNILNDTPIEKYKGGPIKINGDKEFTSANGVVKGSGTPADPYIIEGWTIDASTSDSSGGSYGILISQTSKYFIIRNCRVENATGYGNGIGLFYVTNGKIENCTFTNNYGGILLDAVNNFVVSGNTIENCKKGAGMPDGSHRNNNVTISNNVITNCDGGIDFHYYSNSYVLNNTIRKNTGTGIYMTATMNSTISGNTVQDNTRTGIYAGYSNWAGGDHNIISDNDVSNNGGTGISTSGSYNNISYNTINGNDWGIGLSSVGLTDISAGHNLISHNTVSNNQRVGFSLDLGCANNTISDNTFVSNNVVNEFYTDTTKQRLPRWYDMDIFSVKVGNSNTIANNTYGTITYHS